MISWSPVLTGQNQTKKTQHNTPAYSGVPSLPNFNFHSSRVYFCGCRLTAHPILGKHAHVGLVHSVPLKESRSPTSDLSLQLDTLFFAEEKAGYVSVSSPLPLPPPLPPPFTAVDWRRETFIFSFLLFAATPPAIGRRYYYSYSSIYADTIMIPTPNLLQRSRVMSVAWAGSSLSP